MFNFSLSLLLGLALAATSVLRADFSGAYSVGTPGSYNLVSGATTAFGQWEALGTTTTLHSKSNVDTSSAPASIILTATGENSKSGGTVPAGTATTDFTFESMAIGGQLSFTFVRSGNGGSFTVFLDNLPQTAATASSYTFAVTPGQTLTFRVSATGVAPTFDFFSGTATTGIVNSIVTISNFVTPSAVPEPSSCAALAGTAFLGLALTRRRGRHA